jgi:phosphogluconate dehydratase
MAACVDQALRHGCFWSIMRPVYPVQICWGLFFDLAYPLAVNLHPLLLTITQRIVERSIDTRQRYLQRVDAMAKQQANAVERARLGCTNLAHGYAASPAADKIWLREQRTPNVAIVSAYNDMLSAHQPLQAYPEWIKQAVREVGATAQFAGGVPAMCDGVTQGQAGMELSLFSRDVIAMSTAIALSHQMFDAVLCLGVCDKIVPGLLMGALSFGHLPTLFVPAGPMPSGLPNDAKAKFRQRFAAGEINEQALLVAEEQSYHAPGTCTFYGTANSNQMLMEVMGLHLPGTSFVPPGTALREALTRQAAQRVVELAQPGSNHLMLAQVIDEKAIVNGIVGLLATGGSTNHTLHLVAIARAAGVLINWGDFDALSSVVPLLTRIYPNGQADVNDFHQAGGMGVLIGELLSAGLLHPDVQTVAGGQGLKAYTQQPTLADTPAGTKLTWQTRTPLTPDASILATAAQPFAPSGGLRLLQGNLGRAIIKVSSVAAAHWVVEAPAKVFHDQEDLLAAHQRGELQGDFIAVVRGQGPQANGMPELHALTPVLGLLQSQGQRVALVTDGRMSGASGKVPAAIHVTPEVMSGGPLSKVRDGDIIRLDAVNGRLDALVPENIWLSRSNDMPDRSAHHTQVGRELFGLMRRGVSGAEDGACTLFHEGV